MREREGQGGKEGKGGERMKDRGRGLQRLFKKGEREGQVGEETRQGGKGTKYRGWSRWDVFLAPMQSAGRRKTGRADEAGQGGVKIFRDTAYKKALVSGCRVSRMCWKYW